MPDKASIYSILSDISCVVTINHKVDSFIATNYGVGPQVYSEFFMDSRKAFDSTKTVAQASELFWLTDKIQKYETTLLTVKLTQFKLYSMANFHIIKLAQW